MKKIYSYVLMVTALLIGTNAWAVYPAGWLQDQFDAIEADGQTHTITMEDDIVLTVPVYLGTATVDEDRKSIILEMNGRSITMDASAWVTTYGNKYCSMFNITHGELFITNRQKSTTTSLIQMTGTGYGEYNDIFNVAGSYKSSRWVKNGDDYEINESAAKNTRDADGGWFTHLVIDEGVKLVATNDVSGAGISIDGYYTLFHGMVSPNANVSSVFGTSGLNGKASAVNVSLYNRTDAPLYNTAILSKESEGVAYGVRVEIYGDIEFATGSTNLKSYGIKLNGGLRSSLRSPETFENRYCWAMDEAYARTYGATASTPNELTIDSTSATPALKNAYFNHKEDTIDVPFLYIAKGAHVTAAANNSKATAVYCSGYGKTLIEGACSGNSGVNIKAGTVELHDAEITGTANDYSQAQPGNHATGTGGVIVNSVENRAGGIEVIISGDTKVSTSIGYAIEETINKGDNVTDVSSIAIQGGTIEGGTLGAIAITTETKDAVAVTGGNFGGSTSVGGNTVNVSTLTPANDNYHTTEVVVNNKTVIVVSKGAQLTGDQEFDDWSALVAYAAEELQQHGDTVDVKWTAAGEETISTKIILGELQLISGTAGENNGQVLTITNGATLDVKHLMMNDYARIIVEAGGKLIVEGTQGIIAPKVESILLMASEADGQALFLIHPNVNSNRHPNATVQLTSKAKYDQVAGKNIWQRFGVPSYIDTLKRTDVNYDHTAYPTAWQKIDHQDWVNFPASEKLKPFVCYGMTTSATTATGVYEFMCPLMGNENVTLPLTDQWNYYANSYMAPIDIKKLMANLKQNNGNVSGTIYLYRPSNDWWYAINNGAYTIDALKQTPELPTVVNPMQAFVLESVADGANPIVNYKNQVYDPVVNPTAGAPARSRNSVSAAVVEITAADGTTDCVRMLEDAQFSAEFDNSYDAHKFMNENSFNLFASENLSIVATDNLEGTVLSLNTKEQTSFTLTISLATDMDYAIRDNLTGTEIEMVEGATYMFSTAANAKAEGRFEIVPVAKMPTAIENIEETAAVKGIYTITGQFVGNDYHSLPNGVYVVDGKKIVK